MTYEAIARFLKTAHSEYLTIQWLEDGDVPDFYDYITRPKQPAVNRWQLSAVGIGRENIVEAANFSIL